MTPPTNLPYSGKAGVGLCGRLPYAIMASTSRSSKWPRDTEASVLVRGPGRGLLQTANCCRLGWGRLKKDGVPEESQPICGAAPLQWHLLCLPASTCALGTCLISPSPTSLEAKGISGCRFVSPLERAGFRLCR